MTNNNWITPEWLQNVKIKFLEKYVDTLDSMRFDEFFCAEINKEIKNILESAEKKECKDCKHAPSTSDKQECCYCFYEPILHINWTPKDDK